MASPLFELRGGPAVLGRSLSLVPALEHVSTGSRRLRSSICLVGFRGGPLAGPTRLAGGRGRRLASLPWRPVSEVPSIPLTSGLSARAGGRVWVTALLDLVFPPFCPVCQSRLGEGRRDPLCGACWERLERITAPYCRVCGLPVSRLAHDDSDRWATHAPLCGGCRRHLPLFSYARSATRYEGVARDALHAFKFGGCRGLAAPLGDLLAEIGRGSLGGEAPDLLVAVPLHRRREEERGFNQSLLLARRLGRAWGLPARGDVLARTIPTPPQAELGAEARRANVRGAFVLRHPELVAGRHIVVVDDVFTTGSTVTACARCLKQGRARAVGVVTVARAI